MNGIHLSEDSDEQIAQLCDPFTDRVAEIDALCDEIATVLPPMFDEGPAQRATVTAYLNDFELDRDPRGGFAAFLADDPERAEFVARSAVGWSMPEILAGKARNAWHAPSRELEGRAKSRHGARWSAVQVPPRSATGLLSEAVLGGAPAVAQLFDEDFHVTASGAVKQMRSGFDAHVGLREHCRWQREYWREKPADAAPPVAGWWARLLAWLRRLFGGGATVAEMEFFRDEVSLDVLPRAVAVQHELWRGYEHRKAEGAQLDADSAAWAGEFSRREKDLEQARERRDKAMAEIPRAVDLATSIAIREGAVELSDHLQAVAARTRQTRAQP